MAVPGRKAEDVESNKSKQSEELSQLFCQPCDEDGQQLPAAGFCVDCCEYLCDTCFTHHRRARPVRHHVLQDRTTMPRNKPQMKPSDVTGDKCNEHQGEIIKFYCRSHDHFGCATCIAVDHHKCDGVIYVEKEYEELSKKLTDVKEQIVSNEINIEKNVKCIEQYYSDAIVNIGQFRKEINDLMDKLEHDITEKSKTIKDEDHAMMTSISAKMDEMKNEINSTATEINTLHNLKQSRKLFAIIDKTKVEIKRMDNTLIKILNENTTKRYAFEPEKRLTDLLGNVKSMGTLSEVNHSSNNTIISLTRDMESKTQIQAKCQYANPDKLRVAEHISDINVNSPNDNPCYITGSVLLPDNQLVIVDSNNRKVKLVSTTQNTLTSEIRLSSQAWDVTMINNSLVAMTLPNEGIIQLLSVVSQSLSADQNIKVNGACHGIEYNDRTFIVTFVSPGKVEIINMDGTVVRSLVNNYSRPYLFSLPWYSAINPDKTAMYVPDFTKHSVTCMTLEGKVKAVYKDDNLKMHRGFAIDRTGTVYVCGQDSNNIHQITANCAKIQILLDKQHGISSPQSITYCGKEDKLYIGMYQNNVMKVFHLK